MKNTFRRSAVIALAAVMSGSVLPAGSAFAAGGSGSAPALVSYDVNGNGTVESGEKAYRIENANQLDWFSRYVNAGNPQSNAYLANNIDLSTCSGSEPFRPIGAGLQTVDYSRQKGDKWGKTDFEPMSFSGVFDGNGKSIRNLNISNTENLAGLFGSVSENGEVRNVTVYGTVHGRRAGGIAGDLSGRIVNCSSYVNVYGDATNHYYHDVGGIAGYVKGGIIEQCCNFGTIETVNSGSQGGIAGYMVYGALVSDCFNYGNVHGTRYTGGICGEMEMKTLVRCCGNEGEVLIADGYLEGRAGGLSGHSYGWIENCYNIAHVSGTQDSGGLISGFVTSLTYDYGTTPNGSTDEDHSIGIKNCYNIGNVDSTITWAASPLGRYYNGTQSPEYCYYASDKISAVGTRLSMTEFADEANFTGWDFDNIWIMDSVKGRPVLRTADPSGTMDTSALEGSEHRRGYWSKGTYYICSKANGRYLDLAASSYTTLICHGFNGGNNQIFEFRQGCLKSRQNDKFLTMGDVYDGGFKAVVGVSSSVVGIQRVDADSYRIVKTLRDRTTNTTKIYALEVKNPSSASSVTVWNEYQPGNVNQLWSLEDARGGIYTIKNAKSGRVLDMYEANGNLLQHSANGGDNQKWEVIPQGNGYYFIRTLSAVHPGYLNRGTGGRAVVSANSRIVSLDEKRDGVFEISDWGSYLTVENGSMNDAKVLWTSGSSNEGNEWILDKID